LSGRGRERPFDPQKRKGLPSSKNADERGHPTNTRKGVTKEGRGWARRVAFYPACGEGGRTLPWGEQVLWRIRKGSPQSGRRAKKVIAADFREKKSTTKESSARGSAVLNVQKKLFLTTQKTLEKMP